MHLCAACESGNEGTAWWETACCFFFFFTFITSGRVVGDENTGRHSRRPAGASPSPFWSARIFTRKQQRSSGFLCWIRPRAALRLLLCLLLSRSLCFYQFCSQRGFTSRFHVSAAAPPSFLGGDTSSGSLLLKSNKHFQVSCSSNTQSLTVPRPLTSDPKLSRLHLIFSSLRRNIHCNMVLVELVVIII